MGGLPPGAGRAARTGPGGPSRALLPAAGALPGAWEGPGPAPAPSGSPHVSSIKGGQAARTGAQRGLGPLPGPIPAAMGRQQPQTAVKAPALTFLPQILDELHVPELLEHAAEELGLQGGPGGAQRGRGGTMRASGAGHSRLCFAPPPQTAGYWPARLC